MADPLVRNLDPQRERVALTEALVGKGSNDLVRVNEPYIPALRDRTLQGDVEVYDLKLVLDERPAGVAIFPAPLDIGEVDAANNSSALLRIADWFNLSQDT